jgi:mRNA-degrading endonuclease HigB of HigAB toxin-antitoxin module
MLTFVGVFILIVIIIIVAGTKKQQPAKTNSYKKESTTLTAKTTNRLSSKKERELAQELTKSLLSSINVTVSTGSDDHSIIDVSGNSYKIPSQISSNVVPYWPHFYVYSYQDLQRAAPEQKAFYQKLRSEFLKGENIDVQGNNNYAFILLFDLLNEFDKHKNVMVIEEQLKRVAENYPRTQPYCRQFLISRLRSMGDYQAIERINKEFTYVYHPTEYENFYYRLGDKYKAKLDLNKDQLFLVNKLWDPGNNFCSIEFCLLQSIKLYLLLAEKLNRDFADQNSSLEKELETISVIVASRQFNYKAGSYNYKYTVENTTNELYRLIFKHAENALRNHYGHKRKLTTDVFYHKDAKQQWEENIVSKLISLIPEALQQTPAPDEATEIALNEQSTSRWKTVFEKIKLEDSDSKSFLQKVVQLGELNKKNPSVENIFFEASKFIAKQNKDVSLILYIHYLFHDLKSATFDNKQLTKTIQKSLFKNNEELQEFEKIVSDLIRDKDLEKALKAVPQVYKPKRKRIKLDAAAITEVKEKHSATVDLLDDILNDEYEDELTSIKSEQINSEEVMMDIFQKTETPDRVIANNPYGLNGLQQELLEYFSKNSFALTNDEIEGFTKSRGVFKNQLIESINETCYDVFDDVLIEEEGDNYIISEQYYQRILIA